MTPAHLTDNGFIAYESRAFRNKSVQLIETANEIIGEYQDAGYMACKGYLSQSAMWTASQRLINANKAGQKAVLPAFRKTGG